MPSDRPPLRFGALSTAQFLACCALGGGLASCGGRAADGRAPEATGPTLPDSVTEPAVVRPMRETCEDNPLLADCPYANTGVDPVAPPDEQEPIIDDEPQYITAARNVLAAYCGACHGTRLTEGQASAAINYIDDWDRLMQAGLIEACSPGRSRIIQVMLSGEMPPPNSGLLPVVDQDIDVVTRAIEFDCR